MADKPFGEEAAEENFLGEPGLDDSEKKSGGKCAPPHSGIGALYCCPGRQQVRDPPKPVSYTHLDVYKRQVRENISCGHEMSEDKIRSACEAARLMEWLKTMPEGLDTFVGERGLGVSGGQAQRIAIARAIARDAPVFLLDEATSALDGDTSGDLLSNLEEITRGKTVVHVAHRPEVLKACSKIWRLEGGRLYDQTNA